MSKRVLRFGAIAIGAMVWFGTVAAASVPDASGVIHGCYLKSTGALRVIDTDASGACKATENAISWGSKQLSWKGTWDSATAYQPEDAISIGGSSYVALLANTNKKPATHPTDWALIAQKGAAPAVSSTLSCEDGCGPGTAPETWLTGSPNTVSLTKGQQVLVMVHFELQQSDPSTASSIFTDICIVPHGNAPVNFTDIQGHFTQMGATTDAYAVVPVSYSAPFTAPATGQYDVGGCYDQPTNIFSIAMNVSTIAF